MSWTFGDLRTFFHEEQAPSAARFDTLFQEMMWAHENSPQEVEEVWLPYALEQLARWPDHTRRWEFGEMSLLDGPNPLHALGRFLEVRETNAQEMIEYCQAPDVRGLRSLHFDWVEDVAPTDLALALDGLRGTNLEHLGLATMTFDDACARALADATHLTQLRSLDLTEHAMSEEELLTLASAPHLSTLRHMTFGDMGHCGRPGIMSQLALMRALPHLQNTLTPQDAVHWSLQHSSYHELDTSWEATSVRERVHAALAIFRDANHGPLETPNLAREMPVFGGLTEVPLASFANDALSLEDVFPGLDALAQTEDYDISTIHVAVLWEGALDAVFDEDGALCATLELRAFARTSAPHARQHERYDGACLIQTAFARQGLCLDEGEDGVLRLTLEGATRRSALVRFWRAVDIARTWVGGVLEDGCCCWPAHDALYHQGYLPRVRATIDWEETQHAFGPRGELPDIQIISVRGDGVALFRALEAEGFSVEAGTWEGAVYLREG